MYAIVRSGGKEYRISKGDILKVEKLEGKPGDAVTLQDILMVSGEEQVYFGTPLVANAIVKGEIVQHIRGGKVLTYKMKHRKNYRRMKGHRQGYTYVKVNEIALG